MLNQGDRKHLDAIEQHVHEADPDFAIGLRLGAPRRPRGDRRWSFAVAAALCVVVGCAAAVLLVRGGGADLAVGLGLAVAAWAGLLSCSLLYRRHLLSVAHRLGPVAWSRSRRSMLWWIR